MKKSEALKFVIKRKGVDGETKTRMIATKVITVEEEVLLDREALELEQAQLKSRLSTVEQALAKLDEFEAENKLTLLEEASEEELQKMTGKVNQELLDELIEERKAEKMMRVRQEQLNSPLNQDLQKARNEKKNNVDLSTLPENQDHEGIKQAEAKKAEEEELAKQKAKEGKKSTK